MAGRIAAMDDESAVGVDTGHVHPPWPSDSPPTVSSERTDRVHQQSEEIHDTLRRYVAQLRDGCGDDRCEEVLCHTGRVNTSRRPVRRYTVLSARIIALSTCSGPQPRSHLCKFFSRPPSDLPTTTQETHGTDTAETRRSEESPASSQKQYDPQSLVQLMANTASLARLQTNSPLFDKIDLGWTRTKYDDLQKTIPEQWDPGSSPIERAQKWMQIGNGQPTNSLSASLEQRLTYFRAVNHLRMREAAASARKAYLLRQDAMADLKTPPLPEGIRVNETYYLLLSVSRDSLFKDTLDQLWHRDRSELLLPLRVRLGELNEMDFGQDLGGVQVEFFNLLCRQAFAQDAQLFDLDTKTGIHWLRQGSLQPLHIFEMLGVLIGIAIYNGITLPIDLPLCFYVYIRRRPPAHLHAVVQDRWPEIAANIEHLTDEAVEDLEFAFPVEANGLRLFVSEDINLERADGRVLLIVYDISIVDEQSQSRYAAALRTDGPGASTKLTVESLGIEYAWPGWRLRDATKPPKPVVADNKSEYITTYIKWFTLYSVMPQFMALLRGFEAIFPSPDSQESPLSILGSPMDVKRLLEGTRHLDITALAAATVYERYEAESEYICWFWEIVRSWDEDRQRRLLKFVTAMERIPYGGESLVRFVIERSNVDDGMSLPTSSTCFGTLSLPQYDTKETLKEKLEMAVDHASEGFGLV